MQALLHPAVAQGRSMDLVSKDEGTGAPTSDWVGLFSRAALGM